jgi:hypothetical protein
MALVENSDKTDSKPKFHASTWTFSLATAGSTDMLVAKR